MSNFQQILKAIKNIDFTALEKLLDDDKSYMDVPKQLFIERLQFSIKEQSCLGFSGYDNIVKGKCGVCNKGCDAYSFQSEGNPSLNLFFETESEHIEDIYLCCDFVHDIEADHCIKFFFYKEETARFIPGENYLIDKQKTERAVAEFKKLTAHNFVDIEDLVYWDEKYKDLTDIFGWNDLYHPYKYLNEFDDICRDLRDFVEFYNTGKTAKEAMTEYKKLSNEKDLVAWLFKHQSNKCFNEFKGLGNWKKTGFIKFGPNSDIVVDCSVCLDAFKLPKVYDKEYYRILRKYAIKGVDDNGILYNLKIYLKLRKKYLDILPLD